MKFLSRLSFATILLCLGFLLCLYPALFSTWSIFTDSGIRDGGPTKLSFRLHKSLSKKLPDYIDARIESKIATTLNVDQIEATEWPLYGAYFYLRTTETLQSQWEADQSLASTAPKKSGKEAIEASARLLLDENHAHWVKLYWGDNYHEAPNCFYRLLIAGGLGAHYRLTGSDEHLPVLRSNLEGLIHHLDASPHGLIDDYPGQCFPMDVVAAIGVVQEYSNLIGQDRSDWAKQTISHLLNHSQQKLPAYTANAMTGDPQTPSRGCTNGFGLPFIHQIDPASGEQLYREFTDRFWQEGTLAHGWREFDHSHDSDWFYFDPDSGPVLWNFGTSSTGLGLGVAGSYGDQHRSSLLGSELLATSVPLPNGRLLVPSLVGNRQHAPYFPEIVLMHQLSQSHFSSDEKGPIPVLFWIITVTQIIVGGYLLRSAFRLFKKTFGS